MARLVDVFSGKSKTYSKDGNSFQTAIKKTSVHGSVIIDFFGVVGNEIANHKNALYAFSDENYAYWQNNADLDVQWQAGLFGENLAITGLTEQALFIGDTLQIGTVVLQVSGCRTPCSNLLWQLGAPERFLSEFQQSGHCGFYLEVLATGSIKKGDAITHTRTHDDSISVADLALFFMNANPQASELKRLLNIPGMGQQMLNMLTSSLNHQRERALVFQDRWTDWHPLVITDIVDESDQIKSFYLAKTGTKKGLAGYKAGQYLTLKIKGLSGEELVRCWSLSNYDEILQQYRISIKREPDGNASQCMHDNYRVGDQVEVMAPMGQFTLKRNDIAVPVVLISAGVGITPMVSMLKSHAQRLDKRLPTLHFIHSTQSAATHAFKDEVSAIINRHEHFHQHIIYTRAEQSSTLGVDHQQSKRLDAQSLGNVLAHMGCWFSEKWIDTTPAECHYYLCGPESFIGQTKDILAQLGVPDAAVFDESFISALTLDFDKTQVAANVNFVTSEQTAQWQPKQPMTLLELAEDSGLTPAYSCRNGRCGLCAIKLMNGAVSYVTKPAIAALDQHVLLCCAIPKGDVELAL
jgi:ferredoxin-NADP reductase/MOSC domain-containing protein YiiM